jgi:hypothetical protein
MDEMLGTEYLREAHRPTNRLVAVEFQNIPYISLYLPNLF